MKKYISQLLNFIYRIKFWLILFPLLMALNLIYKTRNQSRMYDISSTIYTGIMTGINLSNIVGNDGSYYSQTTSLMENLLNIVTSESTLKRVSVRLFARCMINGSPYKDTKYISAANYREIYNRFAHPLDHANLLPLIDKSSEDNTVNNLLAYEKADKNNFVYGLVYYTHPLFSLQALKNIEVKRIGESDMLEINYSNSDPGIAYNTIDILNKEFIAQYQMLRYGETNDVISYFRQEIAKVGGLLHGKEDSLTEYNIKNRVINYDNETMSISSLNSQYELTLNQLQRDYVSSSSALRELNRQLGAQTDLVKKNAQFLAKLQNVSNLEASITQKEIFSNSDAPDPVLNKYKGNLKSAERSLKNYAHSITALQTGKDGIDNKVLLDDWLDQMLINEKTAAQLKVMRNWKEEIDGQYTKFAPIGSELKRKERTINLVEENYKSLQEALTTALMKQKNLQMSSATLRVLNPPVYPLTPEGSKRKFVVASGTAVTFIFVFCFLLIWDLIDRTLRDKNRAERIARCKVFAAMPDGHRFMNRRYNRLCYQLATKTISNTILSSISRQNPSIINLLSTRQGDGKSFIASWLAEYWEGRGLKVKLLSYHEDFDVDARDYLLSKSVKDLGDLQGFDLVLVEYPSLDDYSIPSELLCEASLNLLITSARRSWTSIDALETDRIKKQTGLNEIPFLLNEAPRSSVEEYTGQLPPYNLYRNILYQISNQSLTSICTQVRMARKNKSDDKKVV